MIDDSVSFVDALRRRVVGLRPARSCIALSTALLLAPTPACAQAGNEAPTTKGDVLRAIQEKSVRNFDVDEQRVYTFGWHGLSGRFSTHQTHSNRPVPAILFGAKASLDTISGKNSPYRDAQKLAGIFGATPPRTVDPAQVYGDQTQLHSLLLNAADAGAKRIVVLLMDGADWNAYAAAAIATKRAFDPQGYAHGLEFFQYVPPDHSSSHPLRSIASVITSPLGQGIAPGFDIALGGVFPWSPQDATYLAGNMKVGFDSKTAHAVTDSASSATSISTGRKTLNGRIGMDRAGNPIEPLGRVLQQRGYLVATVTDVPFGHASPGSFYASVPDRGQYEEIGRQMLGLSAYPGIDVVLGYGYGFVRSDKTRYLTDADLARVQRDGTYEVVTSASRDPVAELVRAAHRVVAARERGITKRSRLFGFFGDQALDHAPYRTADSKYDPTLELSAVGLPAPGETYDEGTLMRMPTLQAMTLAAIQVIDAEPERPALLFVEAGLVDWGLHANNLDNAIGEIESAEQAFCLLRDWIVKTVGWEDAVLLVTSDHGHLLQVDFAALKQAVDRG
ncbi:MAG: alkaline phosphatase [Planctomycetes bacterium]|nr:alkaline phosphatase [Planctomycetota bacterium]MCB9891861.1 alkaline phosphatase [Planctomycetota bacterium]MCB9918717.1 alkaline phosphatase [Planctomycetota bacterium]